MIPDVGHPCLDATKADGQFRKPASNKKLLGLIKGTGFQFTPFEQGESPFMMRRGRESDRYEALGETVQWFLQNYENARTGKPQ